MSFSSQLLAQQVALVLSGGGAKGIAHAGVLKVLEENDIPIDYIVGTSMGSIVGGFYAAGYSPEEIEAIVSSQEMQNWVVGVVEKKYQFSYKQQPIDPSWLTIKMDIDAKGGARLDATMDRDRVLNINLAEKLEYGTLVSNGDFDSLFVPFRGVASNILMEEKVVLDSGVLYEAVRASMAIPLMYRPVRVDGKLLFDGGVYDNFPVSPAINEFNPDIIIGVNVGDKILEEYPYNEDERFIAESILFFMLNKGNPKELDSTDIFIDVPVGDFSPLAFADAKKIYEIGYNAGLAQLDELKQKIKRVVLKKEVEKRRVEFNDQSIREKFDTIVVKGFDDRKAKFIAHAFCDKGSLDFEQAKQGYYRLLSDDYFNGIFPSYSLDSGKYVFSLSGKSDPWLKAKIGGSLTSRNISYMYLGVNYKRLSRVLEHHSVHLFAGPLYESVNIRSKITIPGNRQFYLEPHIVLSHRDYLNLSDYLVADEDVTILDRTDRKYGIIIGMPVNRLLGISLGGSYFNNRDKFNNDQSTAISELDYLSLAGWRVETKLHRDNLNIPQFASQGSRLSISLNHYFTKQDYVSGIATIPNLSYSETVNWSSIKLAHEKYFYISEKFSFGTLLEGVYSNQPVLGSKKSTIYNYPGFYPLMDSRTLMLENFRGRRYFSVGLKNVWSPVNNLQVRIEGYGFNNFERLMGSSDQVPLVEKDYINVSYAATFGLVSQTLIGPVGLHLNYYDDDKMSWGLLLQLGYLLFNDHSLE
jgi:NTE family protein